MHSQCVGYAGLPSAPTAARRIAGIGIGAAGAAGTSASTARTITRVAVRDAGRSSGPASTGTVARIRIRPPGGPATLASTIARIPVAHAGAAPTTWAVAWIPIRDLRIGAGRKCRDRGASEKLKGKAATAQVSLRNLWRHRVLLKKAILPPTPSRETEESTRRR